LNGWGHELQAKVLRCFHFWIWTNLHVAWGTDEGAHEGANIRFGETPLTCAPDGVSVQKYQPTLEQAVDHWNVGNCDWSSLVHLAASYKANLKILLKQAYQRSRSSTGLGLDQKGMSVWVTAVAYQWEQCGEDIESERQTKTMRDEDKDNGATMRIK
jgi:hypothetical protein